MARRWDMLGTTDRLNATGYIAGYSIVINHDLSRASVGVRGDAEESSVNNAAARGFLRFSELAEVAGFASCWRAAV
jgi:hypothetical protein